MMEDENIVAQIPPALLTDTRLGFGFFGSVVPPLCIFGNSPDNVNNYMCHRRQPYLVDNPTQLLNTFNSNAYSFFETSIFRNRDDNFFNIFSDARQKVTTVIPGEDEWGLYYPGLVWRVRSAGTGQLRVTGDYLRTLCLLLIQMKIGCGTRKGCCTNRFCAHCPRADVRLKYPLSRRIFVASKLALAKSRKRSPLCDGVALKHDSCLTVYSKCQEVFAGDMDRDGAPELSYVLTCLSSVAAISYSSLATNPGTIGSILQPDHRITAVKLNALCQCASEFEPSRTYYQLKGARDFAGAAFSALFWSGPSLLQFIKNSEGDLNSICSSLTDSMVLFLREENIVGHEEAIIRINGWLAGVFYSLNTHVDEGHDWTDHAFVVYAFAAVVLELTQRKLYLADQLSPCGRTISKLLSAMSDHAYKSTVLELGKHVCMDETWTLLPLRLRHLRSLPYIAESQTLLHGYLRLLEFFFNIGLARIARIEDRRTRVDLREIFLTRFSRIADNTVNKEWFYDLPIFPQQPLGPSQTVTLFNVPFIMSIELKDRLFALNSVYNMLVRMKTMHREEWLQKVLHTKLVDSMNMRNARISIENFEVEGLRTLFFIYVKRTDIWKVFMNTVRKRPHELKRPIAVRYWFTYENEGTEDQTGTGREPDVREEEGLDYGGPSQEYFAGLSREIHQEDKLLAFQQKSSLCWFNEQFANKSMADCEEFKYVGVLLGLALHNGVFTVVPLPPLFWDFVLGRVGYESCLDGLMDVYPDVYANLVVSKDPYVISELELTFGVYCANLKKVVPLRGGRGPDTRVTLENYDSYMHAYADYLLIRRFRNCLQQVQEGLMSVIDIGMLNIYSSSELTIKFKATALSLYEYFKTNGVLKFDCCEESLDDFNVKKAQWMDNEHKWFMEILEALTPEESSQLCEYITGSPQIPPKLSSAKVVLMARLKRGRSMDRVPNSETCFYKIIVGCFSSKEVMYSRLRTCMENRQGFGIS